LRPRTMAVEDAVSVPLRRATATPRHGRS
jgi:hypothetical protein